MKNIVLLGTRILTLAFALAATSQASAGILISIAETGGDVVATVSGSITLPSSSGSQSILNKNRMAPSYPFFEFGGGGSGNYNIYSFASTFEAFGTDGFSDPVWQLEGTGSGIAADELFVIDLGNFNVNTAYVSGTEISGTITWAGQTFSSMGLTVGNYSRALLGAPTQTVTMQIGSAPDNAVPAPSTLALVIGGLMLSGYPVRRQLGKA